MAGSLRRTLPVVRWLQVGPPRQVSGLHWRRACGGASADEGAAASASDTAGRGHARADAAPHRFECAQRSHRQGCEPRTSGRRDDRGAARRVGACVRTDDRDACRTRFGPPRAAGRGPGASAVLMASAAVALTAPVAAVAPDGAGCRRVGEAGGRHPVPAVHGPAQPKASVAAAATTPAAPASAPSALRCA